METLVAAHNKLNEGMLAALNAKDAQLDGELLQLRARLAALTQAGSRKDEFEAAASILKRLLSFKTVSRETVEPLILRQTMLSNIGRIELAAEGYFRLTPSSSNAKEWLRQLDSNQRPSG